MIEQLNTLLTNELTSVRQYLLHLSILRDNGINRFAEKIKNEVSEELDHANKLAERILLLKGIPNFQSTNEIHQYGGQFTKETINEILIANLNLEQRGIDDIKKAVSVAEKEKDIITTILLEEILKNEEEHYCWLNKQIHLVSLIGVENYLRTQI